MENGYDMYRKGSSGWSFMVKNEEFQEDDVWSVLKENKDFDLDFKKSKESSSPSSNFTSSAARMIPRPSANMKEPRIVQQQHSAPVSIPDWSKIYGKSNRACAWLGYDDDGDGHHGKESWDSDDDDGGDGDGNMMPPHEWIAQKLARSQIFSFSVCEGAGRTLKGRDLSRAVG